MARARGSGSVSGRGGSIRRLICPRYTTTQAGEPGAPRRIAPHRRARVPGFSPFLPMFAPLRIVRGGAASGPACVQPLEDTMERSLTLVLVTHGPARQAAPI